MTIGQKIRAARKQKGMTLEDLAACCEKGKSWLSAVENDALKGGPDPDVLIKIADFLQDKSILVYSLLNNPICHRIIPRAFEPLNNINDNTSAILAKLREELTEAVDAVDILARIFSVKDPTTTPAYKETLLAKLEQIIDAPRCIEELFSHLKESGAMSEEEHLEVHIRQQARLRLMATTSPAMERSNEPRQGETRASD